MIKVKVPATSANLGSGFDTFGLSLSLHNEFYIEPADKFYIKTYPEDKFLENPDNNLFIKVLKEVFSYYGVKLYPVKIKQINNIPVARGLGSSATAIIAGIIAGHKLLKKDLDETTLLKLAYKFEPHPDNLLPALKGNFVVSVKEDKATYYQQLDFPDDIKAVVLIPQLKIPTENARSVLPEKVNIKDAIFNIQRASLFITALVNRNYSMLKVAMEDKIHQPYRKKLIPGFEEIIKTAYENGALGSALSGAGSSIIALATHNFEKIGSSMLTVLEKYNISGEYKILDIDKQGTQVTVEE